MVFTSTAFLFLFLPAFLLVYYVLPHRLRTGWILLASYAFYAWWRLDFLALFFGTTLFTWLVGRGVHRWRTERPGRARRLLALGVTVDLGVLAYFKYAGFGVESLNALLALAGAGPLPAAQVLLPIGISFYVFQAISYLVDVHRGDAEGGRRFVDVAAYIALFPQLIAGPIVRFKFISGQLARPGARSLGDLGDGAMRFMVGFCKKVLVADAIAPVADAAFALPAPTAADAWLGASAYALQLFFDFSGYSDMAIGLGRMMGFRFLENFDRPYLATSITDFWRRWHISLSRWLRDYLYISLGGNRRGARRTYVNLALVMLLGGLWHGAAWTFVLWGAWHGGWLALERWRRERTGAGEPAGALAVARTFGLVLLGWVTFRADGIGGAAAMYAGMAGANGLALSPDLAWRLPTSGVAAAAAGALIVWGPSLAAAVAGAVRGGRGEGARDGAERGPAPAPRPALWAIGPLFLFGVLQAASDSFSPFLYFQF